MELQDILDNAGQEQKNKQLDGYVAQGPGSSGDCLRAAVPIMLVTFHINTHSRQHFRPPKACNMAQVLSNNLQ
eukprot:jgi/Mesen1/2380/ME000156S01515